MCRIGGTTSNQQTRGPFNIPQWLEWQWPPEWYEVGIMAKELIPIIFTCIVWGPRLAKHHINFQCNNANLVIAIKKGSSKDKFVMHLLRPLSFLLHILTSTSPPLTCRV